MKYLTNLLQETIEILKINGKEPKDVEWVGNDIYTISWKEFEKIADIEYDSGYGAQEIASDLLVVGKGFWLERSEYDGSEGWDFKSFPQKNKLSKPFHYVKVDENRGTSIGWETIMRLENPQYEVKSS